MQFRGIVQKGDRRGHELGFPTINIPLKDENLSGIYVGAVRVRRTIFQATLYADQKKHVLEAHLEAFKGEELYGEEAEIEVLKKIREDKSFSDENELRSQIQDDILATRAYFKTL